MGCKATFRALDRRGIAYAVVDLSEDADARGYVRALGYLQAPVVVTDTDAWSGHRPERLAALAAA
ncbi:glutaredoxin domain-containing protein [Skermania sp. ID1734]|uniref:glutaredoxin domain-containing protein n=1 Tax=Skermania sp. ID1734 TaxID=2597516 RepID=UPI002107D497|nr:glutaredoxin domain-containing protein [Skermania sp. ID1734]